MNKRSLDNVPRGNTLKFPIGGTAYITENNTRIKVTIEEVYPYMVLCRKDKRLIGVPKSCFICGEAFVL